jgi:outer membrane protein assembly factor BamB
VHSGVVYAGSDDETLYALDLKTGKLLWRFEVTGPVRSEPIVVDEFLVFTSADGKMYAVDISPTPFVWQFSTKGAPTFETSVFNDLILTGDTAGIFYALDAKSGEERWRFKPNGKVLSSPAFQKEVLYLGDDDGVLYALELKTGKEKWRIRTRSSHVGSPIVMGSTVYVASSKTETTMQGISTGPLYSYLHAYDIWTGAEKWCFGAVDGIREDLMLHAGGVVFRTTQGLLISVDRHSGKQRWRINIGSRYGAGRYRVLFEKGRAFMLGSEKNSPVLVAVDLADGNIIWKRKVHGFSLRRQADLVTVSMHDGQRCFSMKTGKTKSCPSKPVRRGRSAVTHGGTAYYYCGRGYLCAEDEKSGKERWRVPVKGYPRYDLIFHEGLLYVTTSMGHIYALDPKSMR